ncbi:hypothetical protein LR69_02006 [Geobacillus sp. BCO2]|nr:hypothetical protein LR69_02006 [Geobacillus sp. BCO2]
MPIEWRFPFSVALLVIFIFYTVTLLYVFPIYVHYELRFWQYIKYAFFIGMANPFMTLVMLISVGVLFVLLMYIPGLIPFFSISSLALVVMSGALRVFRKTEERLEVRKQGGDDMNAFPLIKKLKRTKVLSTQAIKKGWLKRMSVLSMKHRI